MQSSRTSALPALLLTLVFLAAACTGESVPDALNEEPVESTTTQAPATTAPSTTEAPPDELALTSSSTSSTSIAPAVDKGNGELAIGTLAPVTGSLSFLGPPQVLAAQLAVDEINAEGGVLGTEVMLVAGDSGSEIAMASETVGALLDQNVDSIVGPASSAVSMGVIDMVTGADVIHFSPANTLTDFSTYDDNGLYFRTAPSDLLQAKVLAELVAEEGSQSVAVLYRDEPYGIDLAGSFQTSFETLGGRIEADAMLPYNVATEDFDALVETIVSLDPDGVVIISFAEAATILETLHGQGFGPTSAKRIYGVDGFIGGIGGQVDDPSILSGLRGIEPSVDLTTISDFTDRLDEAGLDGAVYSYGAETYDAVVIVALAAEAAGSDYAPLVAAQINDVTRTGEKCRTFADCRDLLAAGIDIDFDGVGGPYEFVDAGEPAAASFRILTYDGSAEANSDLDQYVFAQ